MLPLNVVSRRCTPEIDLPRKNASKVANWNIIDFLKYLY